MVALEGLLKSSNDKNVRMSSLEALVALHVSVGSTIMPRKSCCQMAVYAWIACEVVHLADFKPPPCMFVTLVVFHYRCPFQNHEFLVRHVQDTSCIPHLVGYLSLGTKRSMQARFLCFRWWLQQRQRMATRDREGHSQMSQPYPAGVGGCKLALLDPGARTSKHGLARQP